MKYPILMADVKRSRDKNSQKLILQFKKITETVNSEERKRILSPLTITLGDEFQGVCNSVQDGVEIIFRLEEEIVARQLELKLRYNLNLGEIETKINRKIAYEMLGAGFAETRENLQQLKKSNSRFLISIGDNDSLINKAFMIYQAIVDSWKRKDLVAVTEFLKVNDYKKVAKKIKKDISSTWRRKNSLQINEYYAIKEIIAHLIRE